LDELAVGGDEPSEDGTTDVGPAGDDDVPVVVGLTFSVDVGAGAIQIAARRGFHDRLPSARLTTPKGDPKARLEAPADRRGVSPRRAQAGAIRWMPAAEFPVPVAEVPLVAAYREWIRRQTARIDNPASGLGEVPRALELHDRRWHP
jgi:hypothetical protein